MEYKIIKRVLNGKNTVGFQVISKNKKQIIISRRDIIDLAISGKVFNAVYNKRTNSLSGKNGTDLRKLPVIQKGDLDRVEDINGTIKSNHQRLKEYQAKQSMLGANKLVFKALPNDNVALMESKDTENTGKLVIPSFVTQIRLRRSNSTFAIGPLCGCKYTEVFVDNQPGLSLSVKGLCSSMLSNSLKVVFRHPECISNISDLFNGCMNLEYIDISNFDTANAIDASSMFKRCSKLRSLDLSNFNTHNIKLMKDMFFWCFSLVNIDLSMLDTSNVEFMDGMFAGCDSLDEVKLGSICTSKVQSMTGMFSRCIKLHTLDLSRIDTSSIVDTSEMFTRCECLKSLDLSNFNLQNISDMSNMFSYCTNLESINRDKIIVGTGVNISRALYKSGISGKVIIKVVG